MKGRDIQIFGAVIILSGTLVIALDQLSIQSAGNQVVLVEDLESQPGTQDTISGMPYGIPPIDTRDNSRMDNRQSSGWQGTEVTRARSADSLPIQQSGPIEYDTRRDNSRLDSRYDAGFLTPAPSNAAPGR